MPYDEDVEGYEVFEYLNDNNPEDLSDPELGHCYEMMTHHLENHLETGEDSDLGMAKYWLEQARFVESELEKPKNFEHYVEEIE